MSFVCNAPALSILLLILAGVICMPLKERAAQAVCSFAILACLTLSAWLFIYFARGGEAFTYQMGRYGAPFGNELRAGILEAGLAFVFCLVCILSLMGGRKHLQDDIPSSKMNLYYISIIFLLCSMLALDYTNDLFTAYVFIEINTLTACAVVAAKDNGYTHAATMSYLIMSLVGSGLFLIGVCIIYGITGHLLMEPIHQVLMALPAGSPYITACYGAVALFAAGLSLKSALWPFSYWLPAAHGSASGTSSAVLSGLVLKAYILTLIKIAYRVIGLEMIKASPIADVILVMGACAMVVGSVYAMFEKDIKIMLAYSSVGQIGYIFCAIGMGSKAGMVAAIIQIIVHAFTKSMLFLSASNFIEGSGKRDYRDMHGLAAADPLSAVAYGVGALSMIGIPLFAGFATKYSLVGAAIGLTGWRQPVAVAAIIISTVLTAVYYIRVVAVLFSISGHPVKKHLDTMEGKIALSVLIVSNFIIGLSIDGLTSVIEHGLQTF